MVDVAQLRAQPVTVVTDIDEAKFEMRKRMQPSWEEVTGSEWDRKSSGTGRQWRLDLYIEDPVSLARQAKILMEFASKMNRMANDYNLTPRQLWILLGSEVGTTRIELAKVAPSQYERLKRKGLVD